MKHKLAAILIGLSIILPSVSHASLFGIVATTGDLKSIKVQLDAIQQQINNLRTQLLDGATFGAAPTQPIAGFNYTIAGSGVSAAASNITLVSLTFPQTGRLVSSTDVSATFYITMEPGNTSRQEIASCTSVTQNANGTATLTGCSRGLLPFPPYTASSTYAFPHGGGSKLIFSDAPQLFNQYAALANTSTISGVWTFASSSLPKVSADTTQVQVGASNQNFATVAYVASTSIAGAVPATTVNAGIVKIATSSDLANGNTTSTYSLVPDARNFSSSSNPSAAFQVPVAVSGTLAAGFINQSGLSLTSTTLKGNTVLASSTSGLIYATTTGALSPLSIGSGLAISGSSLVDTNSASTSVLLFGVASVPSCNSAENYVGTSTITTDGTQRLLIHYAGSFWFGGTGSQISTINTIVYLDGATTTSSGFAQQSAGAGTGAGFSISASTTVLSAGAHTINIGATNTGSAGCTGGSTNGSGFAMTYKF